MSAAESGSEASSKEQRNERAVQCGQTSEQMSEWLRTRLADFTATQCEGKDCGGFKQ